MGLTAGIRMATLTASHSTPDDSNTRHVMFGRRSRHPSKCDVMKFFCCTTRSQSGHCEPAGKAVVLFATCACLCLAPSLILTSPAQVDLANKDEKASPAGLALAPETPQVPALWPQNRYLCFSNTAILPPVHFSAADRTIRVGNLGALPIARLSALSTQEAKTAAAELGVPTGLVMRVAKRASEKPPIIAEEIARQLRAAVIDF